MSACGAQYHSALGFSLWDLAPKGPIGVPCLVVIKAAEVVALGGEGAQCLSGNSLHFWAQAAQVPLALSTVLEGGLQEDPACSCTPKVPPRAHRWPGLGNPWRWGGVYGKGSKPSGSLPISHGFVFCATVPWSVVLLKVAGD